MEYQCRLIHENDDYFKLQQWIYISTMMNGHELATFYIACVSNNELE